MKLAWAPFSHPARTEGYGVIAGRLRHALKSAGISLISGAEFGWDAVVVLGLPAAWAVTDAGRPDMIWHTMYEMEPLPPGWADVLNKVGAVWVPSNWCYRLFRDAGVTVPMFVSGYGVDQNCFFPVDRKVRIRERELFNKPLKFMAWGHTLTGRKNVLMAIRAFIQAGLPPDKAILEVKLQSGESASFVNDASGNAVPGVKIFAEQWSERQIGDWLRSGDCLIYTSAGEGYGLMPAEAGATGATLICANNTGMQDYLTVHNALLVPSIGTEQSPMNTIRFNTPMLQETVDQEAIVRHIRWVFENQKQACEIGEEAASDMSLLTWENAGLSARREIEALLA